MLGLTLVPYADFPSQQTRYRETPDFSALVVTIELFAQTQLAVLNGLRCNQRPTGSGPGEKGPICMRLGALAAVVAALMMATPAASAVPTYAEGDEFAQEVYDRGILSNFHPDILVQELANICYQAEEGAPTNYIVALYMDGYGLSKKDAAWMVNTALDKCD